MPSFARSIARSRDFRADKAMVQKFGIATVGTTYQPICAGGYWRTPQVADATQLRIKAGNANDDAAGSGAQEITIIGIDASGAEVEEALATAGTLPSANSINSYIRLYRVYVSKCGTHDDLSMIAHGDDIVIENAAGTEDWALISAADVARAQSQIGCYTIPNVFSVAALTMAKITIDSNKTCDVLIFRREGILKESAPYDAMRVGAELIGLSGTTVYRSERPLSLFPAGCDVGFLARVSSGSADISVNFELVLG